METLKPEADAREKAPKPRRRLWLYALFPPAVLAFVLGVFLLPGLAREWIVETAVVLSGGMMDTILVGDYVATDKRTYRSRDPRLGEIVTFTFPYRDTTFREKINHFLCGRYGSEKGAGLRLLIMRVVGGPGDVLELKGGVLHRNGEPVYETYTFGDAGDDWGPYTVPPDRYFVMGDNRYGSVDSRFIGPVPREYIRGRATKIFYSIAPVSCPRHGAPIVRYENGWRCSAGGEDMRPGLDFKPVPRWRVDLRVREERIGLRLDDLP